MRIPLPGGGYIENDNAAACYRHMLSVLGGWVEEDGEMVIRPLDDIETFRTWALSEVQRRRNDSIAEYIKPVYAKKEMLAREVLAGSKSDYLAMEAQARRMTPADLARLVLKNADSAARQIDAIEAWYYTTKRAIESAKTIDEIIDALVTGLE